MTTPPLTQKWVPLWPVSDVPAEVPTPVDGKWLKGGPGGSMLWDTPPAPPTGDSTWKVFNVDVGLQNGWLNYGAPYGPGRFRKLASGLVVMEGLIHSGTPNTIAFVMPVGYRPTPQADNSTRDLIFICAVGGTVTQEAIRIQDNGNARPSNAATVPWIDLSGVAFYAGP